MKTLSLMSIWDLELMRDQVKAGLLSFEEYYRVLCIQSELSIASLK